MTENKKLAMVIAVGTLAGGAYGFKYIESYRRTQRVCALYNLFVLLTSGVDR